LKVNGSKWLNGDRHSFQSTVLLLSSIPFAKLVRKKGKVIAVDIKNIALKEVGKKAERNRLQKRK